LKKNVTIPYKLFVAIPYTEIRWWHFYKPQNKWKRSTKNCS